MREFRTKNVFPKQFSLAKSLSGKYLFACENMAEVTGLDSPSQIVGLRDADLIWKDWSEALRQEDATAFRGDVLLNHPGATQYVQEVDKIRKILTTKTALRDSQNQIIGVIGSAIEITDHHILHKQGHFDEARKKFTLNDSLAGLTFSKKQITLLQYIIMGYSAAEIGNLTNRSKRTIEGHIETLKNKLQCTSKAEIIRIVVTSGLLHGIEWPRQHRGLT